MSTVQVLPPGAALALMASFRTMRNGSHADVVLESIRPSNTVPVLSGFLLGNWATYV